jgi:hypothetical protein
MPESLRLHAGQAISARFEQIRETAPASRFPLESDYYKIRYPLIHCDAIDVSWLLLVWSGGLPIPVAVDCTSRSGSQENHS